MCPHIYTLFMFKKRVSVFITQIATNPSFMFLWGKWMKKSVTLKSLTVFCNPFEFTASHCGHS